MTGGGFVGRGGGDGEGEGKHAVSLGGLVASWLCWWGARRSSKESPKALSTEGTSCSCSFSGWRMQRCNCRNQAGR
jgi:hypothetical protein